MTNQWECVVRLSSGWQTTVIVNASNHTLAKQFAESQTGGKCLAAYPIPANK